MPAAHCLHAYLLQAVRMRRLLPALLLPPPPYPGIFTLNLCGACRLSAFSLACLCAFLPALPPVPGVALRHPPSPALSTILRTRAAVSAALVVPAPTLFLAGSSCGGRSGWRRRRCGLRTAHSPGRDRLFIFATCWAATRQGRKTRAACRGFRCVAVSFLQARALAVRDLPCRWEA